jgi:DNA-binding Lrp family transcriptional regulator
MPLTAFVLIETAGGAARNVAGACRELDLPEVDITQVSVVTGPYGVIVRVEAADLNILGTLLAETLHDIPGVQHTVTCIELA